jgi:hypothetical protein
MSLKSLLHNEPLRTYVYGVLGPLLAILVAYGALDANKTALILALGTAVLVPAVTETARQKVTPAAKCK